MRNLAKTPIERPTVQKRLNKVEEFEAQLATPDSISIPLRVIKQGEEKTMDAERRQILMRLSSET